MWIFVEYLVTCIVLLLAEGVLHNHSCLLRDTHAWRAISTPTQCLVDCLYLAISRPSQRFEIPKIWWLVETWAKLPIFTLNENPKGLHQERFKHDSN